MPFSGQILSTLRTVTAIVAAVVLSTGAVLAGSSTDGATKNSAPIRLDPKASELPPSALGMEADESHGYEPGDDKSDTKRPGEFKFGDNTLHIDANKNDPVPPVGLESNGQAVINKAPTEPALQPSYFGFRLTTPIR